MQQPPPPTPPLKSTSPLPPTSSSSSSSPHFTGPIDASGQPIPGGNPSAAWELKRAAWLARRSSDAQPKAAPKDSAFREKLAKLEDLLSGKSVSREEGGALGKGGEKDPGAQQEDEDEPDGGMVVGRVGKGSEKEGELRKAGEAILLAFKQGKALKDPLPLSLVTKLLYRSWLTDGTIPADYVPPPLDLAPPSPPQQPTSTSATTPDDPSGEALLSSPHSAILTVPPLSFAASLYSSALPLPLSDREGMSPSPIPNDLNNEGTETEGKTMRPPPIPSPQQQPQAKGGIDLGEEGRIRVGAITSGASWRTEKDIASGSDLI